MKKIKSMYCITDKELHCMARTIQYGNMETQSEMDSSPQCLYCKYALECSKKSREHRELFVSRLMKKIIRITGVYIYAYPEANMSDMLHGSWIENYPELLEQIKELPFDEQLDILQNPDILRYMDTGYSQQK